MSFLLIGAAVLAAVLGLFYLKDRLESPLLTRFAHSGLIMRFAVLSVALMLVGVLTLLDRLLA